MHMRIMYTFQSDFPGSWFRMVYLDLDQFQIKGDRTATLKIMWIERDIMRQHWERYAEALSGTCEAEDQG